MTGIVNGASREIRNHGVRRGLEFAKAIDPLSVLCLVAGIYAWIKAGTFVHTKGSVVNAGLFPHIIAVLLISIALLSLTEQVSRARRSRRATHDGHAAGGHGAESVGVLRAAGFFGALVAAVALLEVLGFVLDAVLWTLCACALLCSGWKAKIWAAVWVCAWIAAIYFAFVEGLQLALPGA